MLGILSSGGVARRNKTDRSLAFKDLTDPWQDCQQIKKSDHLIQNDSAVKKILA